MDKFELASRISWALETATDEGYINPHMGLDALLENQYEILQCEFTEEEIDELDENLIKSVFKSWVN